jgi:cytochrome c peroxidase
MLKKTLLGGAIAAALTLPALADRPADKSPDNPQAAKAQLGRSLFFDPSLSSPPGQSCATCHDANAAMADPDRRLPVSKGVLPGRAGNRNTPSARYAAFSPPFHFDQQEGLYVGGQFLDGRAATLEEQARGPFLNPLEMANPDQRSVVEKVRRTAYSAEFDRVFGQGALADTEQAYGRIAEALAAFERTPPFSPFSSKYDAWLAGKAKLTRQEMRGLRLFEAEEKGNCAACHISKPGPRGEPPLFTDFTYDNLGVPRNPDNPFYRLPAQLNPAGPLWIDRGLGAALKQHSEDGKFKVPTLRNVELTGPYMHNGYFKTLRGAVAFYNDRDSKPLCSQNLVGEAAALKQECWPAPEVIANVNHDELGDLGLTEREIDDIVAFMKTLTDGWQSQAGRSAQSVAPAR